MNTYEVEHRTVYPTDEYYEMENMSHGDVSVGRNGTPVMCICPSGFDEPCWISLVDDRVWYEQSGYALVRDLYPGEEIIIRGK